MACTAGQGLSVWKKQLRNVKLWKVISVPIFIYLFQQISTLEVILLIEDHQLIYEGSEKDSGVAWTPVAAPRTTTSNSIQTDYQWCIVKSCAKPGLIIVIISIGEPNTISTVHHIDAIPARCFRCACTSETMHRIDAVSARCLRCVCT